MADSAEDVLDNAGRVIATKDDAGHLIARLLGGEGGKQAWNFVPMNPQLVPSGPVSSLLQHIRPNHRS